MNAPKEVNAMADRLIIGAAILLFPEWRTM